MRSAATLSENFGDLVEDYDEFFCQAVAAEEALISANYKRRKLTAVDTFSTPKNDHHYNNGKVSEGAYTSALKGSKSSIWQQQQQSTTTIQSKVFAGSIRFAEDGAGGAGESDSLIPGKNCPCGVGLCVVFTANTERNRGRKFYRCPVKQENGGCGFFEWCDSVSETNKGMGVGVTPSYASDSSTPDVPCPCGAGSCSVLTAKTEKNIGRQFYTCPVRQEKGGCGFFQWCDSASETNKQMSTNHTHPSNPSFPDVPCPCGAGACSVLTAKTGKNIGRQFYRCPARQGTCGFFKWCDDDKAATAVPIMASKMYSSKNNTNNSSYGMRAGSACFKCGNEDHWAKDCRS